MIESITDTEIVIRVIGKTATIYHVVDNLWSFQYGRFYQWSVPLDECIEKAHKVMLKSAEHSVNEAFAELKRKKAIKALSLR